MSIPPQFGRGDRNESEHHDDSPPLADKHRTVYPARPPFFANDFIRLTADACLANEIGAEACYLLAVVAMTEDKTRYSKPVTFFNSQLTRHMGYVDDDAMADVRKKAVKAGWLSYTQGHKGTAGRYFVVVPPEYADLFPADTTAERREKGRSNAGERAEEVRENGGGSAEKVPTIHTPPCPRPSPVPDPSHHPAAAASGEVGSKTAKRQIRRKTAAEIDPRFARFWQVYPKKVDKPDAAAEFARIDPSPEVLEQIVAAVERHRRSEDWTKEGGRYITHPKKWLRNRKWEDQIDAPTADPPGSATANPPASNTAADIIRRRQAEAAAREGSA